MVEERGYIEEIVLAIACVVRSWVLSGEGIQERRDIEEVEFTVFGQVRGTGRHLGEEHSDACVAGVAKCEVWAAVAVEIAEGHGRADF